MVFVIARTVGAALLVILEVEKRFSALPGSKKAKGSLPALICCSKGNCTA